MKKAVGFIGLGNTGKPMASNLLKAGFHLTVYDVAEEPLNELAQLGATPVSSPKEVAQASEFVIILVRDAPQVREVIFGSNGVQLGIRKGCTVIIVSTIEPMVVREVADALGKMGVRTIDAAIIGTQKQAIEATISFSVGGDEGVIEDCRDILEVMGKDILYCGDIGTGEVIKIINNYIGTITSLILNEAIVLGVKSGICPKRLIELMVGGSANSVMLEKRWGPTVLQGNFKPGFHMDLALKDMGLAMALANEAKVPVVIGALAFQIFQAECAAGKGKDDFTATVTTLEKLAKVEVRG